MATAEKFVGDHGKIELPPMGRVLSAVLSMDRHKLEKALLSGAGSAGRTLLCFMEHVKICLSNGTATKHLWTPLLEHVVKSKDQRNYKQVLSLVQWLFQSEELELGLTRSLASTNEILELDNRLRLGWCLVVRGLVQRALLSQSFEAGALVEKSLISKGIIRYASCIPLLLQITCSGRSGEAPTRLAVAAADCMLVITRALTERISVDMDSEYSPTYLVDIDSNKETFDQDAPTETQVVLYKMLDNLVTLVQVLFEWNDSDRPLHARGILQIKKHLKNLVTFRDSCQAEGEANALISIVTTSWHEYSMLLSFEEFASTSEVISLLQKYTCGLEKYQYCSEGAASEGSRRFNEIQAYLITCVALLLGKLSHQLLEAVLVESEQSLVQVLLSQLYRVEDDIVDIIAAILRAIIFRPTVTNDSPSRLRMEAIAPCLMELLDRRDSTARAVVLLIAEYLLLNPSGLEKLFQLLDTGNAVQRRNALDVISELVSPIPGSEDSSIRETVAQHLLKRLGDEELFNRTKAANLFSRLDPRFVLPQLVQLIYATDARVRSAASSALIAMLAGHSNQCLAISVLLNISRNLSEITEVPVHPGYIGESKVRKSDPERIMNLMPSWATTVTDWGPIISFLLDKMFAEPENPLLPMFLSRISRYISKRPDLLLPRILELMMVQTKSLEEKKQGKDNDDDGSRIFQWLSPLLVLKVLNLEAFQNIDSKELYGGIKNDLTSVDATSGAISCTNIAMLLIDRMSGNTEYEDVRKLSAELCGRLLPDVILPMLAFRLEEATKAMDAPRVKAYIFAICNSLMIWESQSFQNPKMMLIQALLASILMWPVPHEDFVNIQKAQHGCIDCFAIMIRTELAMDKHGSKKYIGLGDRTEHKVLKAVMSCLLSDAHAMPLSLFSSSSVISENVHIRDSGPEQSILAFRLCMANVLISTCSKLPVISYCHFIHFIVPRLLNHLQNEIISCMRTAILNIFFNLVYHFKDRALVPYANDLLMLSLSHIKEKGCPEERIAGAKLMAALLSNEQILEDIATQLIDVKRVLSSISFLDSSPELRSLCEQLLACMSQ